MEIQISLGIRPVWSESSLSAWRVAKDPGFLHGDSEDSDQTGWMPRLIWVFTGSTLTLLVCHVAAPMFESRTLHAFSTYEPEHDKTNKMTYVPSADSEQPGHPPTLISIRVATLSQQQNSITFPWRNSIFPWPTEFLRPFSLLAADKWQIVFVYLPNSTIQKK